MTSFGDGLFPDLSGVTPATSDASPSCSTGRLALVLLDDPLSLAGAEAELRSSLLGGYPAFDEQGRGFEVRVAGPAPSPSVGDVTTGALRSSRRRSPATSR